MRTIFALLMLTATAQAQMISAGGCSVGSTAWSTNDAEGCLARGGRFSNGGLVFMTTPIPTVTGGSVTVSNAPQPKCDDGWSLVSAGGRVMCAKELREPK